MPTTIAVEAKNVSVFGIETPYQHLYLVKTVTDSAGAVVDERVIRGDVGQDLTLVTQANVGLAGSLDARGSETRELRHHTVIDLGGRDPDEVWNLMVQHAVNIDNANLPYGTGIDEILSRPSEVNSNTTIASVLHAVGIDLPNYLPSGIDPAAVPLFDRIADMLVDDSLFGSLGADLVRGGVGNDTLNGGGGNDQLFGETGQDVLLGQSGSDLLDGGIGADLMDGGIGNDTYWVGDAGDRVIDSSISASGGVDLVISTVSLSLGSRVEMAGIEGLTLSGAAALIGKGTIHDNRITGNSGDNLLLGGAGHDIVAAGRGADRLIGGAGSDTLRGGAGDDDHTGGLGRDVHVGGFGTDMYIFNSVSESRAGLAWRDQIVDFEDAEKIDLRNVDANSLRDGNQAFTFIGSGAFSGRAQLRYELDGDGNTIVQADVNGDQRADFEILLRDHLTPLNAGDFVL
jgi:Ca2+-binding RTX toxin-like protein